MYRKVFGTNSIDSCNYEPDGHNDYCDVQECTFRSQCEKYKYAHPEPVTPEQAEQMTLQWATRMGGVNTSNHQRVENEQPIQGDREPDWLPEAPTTEEESEAFLEELRQHIDERNINPNEEE